MGLVVGPHYLSLAEPVSAWVTPSMAFLGYRLTLALFVCWLIVEEVMSARVKTLEERRTCVILPFVVRGPKNCWMLLHTL